MASASTAWSAPGLATYGGHVAARRGASAARIGRVGFGGATALLLWLLWPALGLAALALPPFLLLAVAFAGAFMVVAACHLAAGRPVADLVAPPAGGAIYGMIGSQLLGLLALGLVFPGGPAVADPWPVLGAGFRALTGWPAAGPQGGAALGYVLGLSGLLCWLACDAARRWRGAAPNLVGAHGWGGVYGWAALTGLVLHLCLEPRLPLPTASLLAALAIGLGPLGLAPLLWRRRSRRR